MKRALLFAGSAAAVRSVTSTLATFSQSMSTVRAITGATDSEFEQLKDTARELGATTRFSATEASAADIASNVMTGFGLATDQASRVVDVLALAANSSNTNVQQLGETMKFVAPVAASAGVSLEEVAAAAGKLGDAGIQASLAGTGLRQAIIKLSAPTIKAQRALESLGLTAADVDPSVVGLGEAFDRLGRAGLDLTTAVDIFDVRTASAALALARAGDETGKFARELESAEGTAARIAETMDDNLNGALLKVKSSIEPVVLSFGDLGAESFLTQLLNRLAAGIRFVSQNANVLEGILATLAIVTLPLVLNGILAIGAAIAANPLGALLTALSIAVGFLVAFRDETIVSADGVTTLGDVARATFERLLVGFRVVREAAAQALDNIVTTWNAIFADDLPATFKGFALVVAKGVDSIIGVFSGAGAAIVVAFRNPFETLKFLAVELANFVIRQINFMIRACSLKSTGWCRRSPSSRRSCQELSVAVK